jgi:hypothetical protein
MLRTGRIFSKKHDGRLARLLSQTGPGLAGARSARKEKAAAGGPRRLLDRFGYNSEA